jgi:hypothetical protein
MAIGHTVPGSLPRSGRTRSRRYESLGADLASPVTEARMESSELGVRAGVDVSVYVDGAERLADLEAGELERCRRRTGPFLDTVGAQLRMVVFVFRAARNWGRLRGDPPVMDDDDRDGGRVLPDLLPGSVVADSLHRVGCLRVVLELPDLADELVVRWARLVLQTFAATSSAIVW